MQSMLQLLDAYRRRQVSPVEIVQALLEKIEASTVNAYITVFAEEALRDARAAEKDMLAGNGKGALHGVPIAIKDIINVAGKRTTMGSQQYAEFIPAEDAAVVSLLRDAGAIIIGKANTHQFAYGPTGDRSYFGAVHNPHDEKRVTGGSSSGSAAAVAAGLAYSSLGSDTGASIRLPAALCGVVGMKPTLGLVSTQGVFPVSEALDHIGPISNCVRDNALLLGVIAGRQQGEYSQGIDQAIRGKVIGLPDNFYCDYVSADIRQALQNAVRMLQDAGAVVKPVHIAAIDQVYAAQMLVLKVEAYVQHADALSASAPFDAEVKERLLTGKDVLAADYVKALKSRAPLQHGFDQAFAQVDVLLTPTSGITAPLIEERSTVLDGETLSTRWLLTRFTAPTNFSGNPSLSVPFGVDNNNLPIGLQLIGRPHAEGLLYQVGAALEGMAK